MRVITRACALIIWSFASTTSLADLVLSVPGSTATIDFSGFTGAGFSPTPSPGQLDSDTWAMEGLQDGDLPFGGTGTAGDFARGSSTGGESTGGIYAFDVGGGKTALGVQPTGGDFTPGSFTLRVRNATGSDVSQVSVRYEVYVWNDQNRSNSFNLGWSTDNSNFTSLPSLDVASPEAADPAPSWNLHQRNTTLSLLTPLPNGGQFYLRWTGADIGGSGSRDEFGLTAIGVTALSAVPEPSSLGMGFYLGIIFAPHWRRRWR